MMGGEAECLQAALAAGEGAQEHEKKWDSAGNDAEHDSFAGSGFDVLEADATMQKFEDKGGHEHPQAQAADHDEDEGTDGFVGRKALWAGDAAGAVGAGFDEDGDGD